MATDLEQRTEAVRRFNRFYITKIGVLDEHFLDSEYSLTEGRVLYEIANQTNPTAADVGRTLNLDAGYLSRILSRFAKRGLIAKTRSKADARAVQLALTAAGHAAFKPLNESQHREIATMLVQLSPAEQAQLTDAMGQIESLLGDRSPTYLLRDPQPGDMGWITHRHGVLYAQEYGWDANCEALTAEIVASFVRTFDPKYERCWIAEKDGKVVGSVFVVRHDDETAQLRLLYVEPSARGLGIGRRLVDECIRFAKHARYNKMMLWTNHVLVGARRIYEHAGFTLVEETPHRTFGTDLIGQTWSIDL